MNGDAGPTRGGPMAGQAIGETGHLDKHDYALDTTWRTLFADLGLNAADLLRRAGLPDDLLLQPAVRLSAPAYYRLWRAIEAAVGADALPLRLCEGVSSESFSPPLFAALCSPDLLTAARRIARYKALIAPIRLDVQEAAGTVTLTFAWPADPAPPDSLVLMELLFAVTLARMGTRTRMRPLAAVTTAALPPAAAYDDFLGTALRRGDANVVVFDAADARLPFLTSNDTMWSAFEPGLRQRLAELDAAASTCARVKAALLEGLPSGLATMDAVARKLALSRRTLQRRIELEGSSYQTLLKDTRTSLARHYLERTALPAAEIAFLLGFDEPNSFYRAFKLWTGVTPETVRRPQASGHASA